MASLEFLDALNHGTRTVGAVADALGIAEGAAVEQLKAAERDGLVELETDESRFAAEDFDRQYLHLTEAGLAELHRLQDAQR